MVEESIQTSPVTISMPSLSSEMRSNGRRQGVGTEAILTPSRRWPTALSPEHRPGLLQVQSIEFTQIEMKVMEGLQVGNECLNKMHQVGPCRAGG